MKVLLLSILLISCSYQDIQKTEDATIIQDTILIQDIISDKQQPDITSPLVCKIVEETYEIYKNIMSNCEPPSYTMIVNFKNLTKKIADYLIEQIKGYKCPVILSFRCIESDIPYVKEYFFPEIQKLYNNIQCFINNTGFVLMINKRSNCGQEIPY